MEAQMKILHLTLKKKWFDLIVSRKKTLEYREDKPYWRQRLLTTDGTPKSFDIIRFKNGYGNVPTIDVEFLGIEFTGRACHKTDNGEIIWPQTMVIKLGRIGLSREWVGGK